MVHPEFLDQPIEELLERIWTRREEGDTTVSGLFQDGNAETEPTFARLVELSLVERKGDRLSMTAAGENRARTLVRRNRLTERLMADILDQPLAEAEHAACLLEHVLSRSVTNAVCTLLGHPPTCPHGLPIPPGACCRERIQSAPPVVVSLNDLDPGSKGRILFMTPKFQRRLSGLESFGVVPGTMVRLLQKRPTFALEVGGTTLALESDVAREIFVRRED